MDTLNMKTCPSKACFPQNTHFPQGRPGSRWTLTVHYTHFLIAASLSPTPDPWILLVRREKQPLVSPACLGRRLLYYSHLHAVHSQPSFFFIASYFEHKSLSVGCNCALTDATGVQTWLQGSCLAQTMRPWWTHVHQQQEIAP